MCLKPGMHKVEIICFFFLIALFWMAHYLISPSHQYNTTMNFVRTCQQLLHTLSQWQCNFSFNWIPSWIGYSPTPFWLPPAFCIGYFETECLYCSVSGQHSLPGSKQPPDTYIFLGIGGLFSSKVHGMHQMLDQFATFSSIQDGIMYFPRTSISHSTGVIINNFNNNCTTSTSDKKQN